MDQVRARLAEYDTACHEMQEQLLRLRRHRQAQAPDQPGDLAKRRRARGGGKRLLHSLPAGTAKRVQSDFVALSVQVQN
jgi:hypothetical protein